MAILRVSFLRSLGIDHGLRRSPVQYRRSTEASRCEFRERSDRKNTYRITNSAGTLFLLKLSHSYCHDRGRIQMVVSVCVCVWSDGVTRTMDHLGGTGWYSVGWLYLVCVGPTVFSMLFRFCTAREIRLERAISKERTNERTKEPTSQRSFADKVSRPAVIPCTRT